MAVINLPNLKEADNVETWAKNFKKAVENVLEEILYGRRRVRNVYEIGNKELDDSDIGDQKVLFYDGISNKVKYGVSSGGDAESIKGKTVDDANIGDKRVLLYDAVGDVIKYASQNDMHVGYADNAAEADYATNADYADNADRVDNEHANAFEHVAKKETTNGYAGLDSGSRLISRQRLPKNKVATSNDGGGRSITSTNLTWENNMKVVLSTLANDLIIVFLTGFFSATDSRLRVETWPYSGSVSGIYVTSIGVQLDANFVKYNQISMFMSLYNQNLDIRQRWRLEGGGTGYCIERSMVAFTVGQV
jgi:hypothetical protein